MAILFVTDGAWGAGVHHQLAAAVIDNNFWEALVAIEALQTALPSAGRSITSISQSGDLITFHMTDSTTEGPFSLPVLDLKPRGTWLPSTSYTIGDLVFVAGTEYMVTFAHLSDYTFDPGANDGLGHDYYTPLFNVPTIAIPAGGTAGMTLIKNSGVDYDTRWANSVLPVGGTTGQFLRKLSNDDFDDDWSNAGLNDLTGVLLTSVVGDDLFQYDGTAGKWKNKSISTLTGLSFASFNIFGDTISPDQQRLNVVTDLATSGTVTLNAELGDVFRITPSGDCTINAANPSAGARVTLIITTAGTTSRTLTFGTNFSSRGPLTTGPVAGVRFSITFVGDGGILYEESRSRPVTNVTALPATTGTVSLDPTLGDVFTVTPTGSITLNAASAPVGQRITLLITTSGTSSFNITPTTNFRSQGALATGIVSTKFFSIGFVGDGNSFWETHRTTAMS